MVAAAAVNLGPKERRKRWIEAAAASFTAAALPWLGVPLEGWIRVVPVLLVTVAVFCALQAASSTCAILAYRGQCNFDCGIDRVRDVEARNELLARARGIIARTVAIAGIATVLACTL
ncbi:MAG TPA: hypothetical protein VG755_42405 [Nannocystaceae bacterium]|nr:hypothetical protein [Nannocystaceae bacterium]